MASPGKRRYPGLFLRFDCIWLPARLNSSVKWRVFTLIRTAVNLCLVFFLIAASSLSTAQEKRYSALIPAFHSRLVASGNENVLELKHQRFVLFVYRNAVAVSAEADFVNTGPDTLSQEFALPSTGHGEAGKEPLGRVSNGILSVQIWMEGQRISPELIHEGNEDGYTIKSKFAPGQRHRVKAIFWAQTSLVDIDSLSHRDTVVLPTGKRGFLIDLAHASVWKHMAQSIDVTLVIKGGMTFKGDAFVPEPDTYHVQDSTIAWSLRNLEPTQRDNIVVSYEPAGGWGTVPNTIARLETFIVKTVYDRLLEYVEQTGDDADR